MLKRNSNIELLRILSMIMIILGHCNIYGNYDIANMNHFFNKFVIGNTYLGNLGVIIFVITTGYFMIQKEIRTKKVILFELQVLFYSVGIYILFCVIGISNFNFKEMIKCFFPIITKQYWFFSVYIIFYLFIPYINKFILNLNRKDLNRYILMMIIAVCLLSIFLSFESFSSKIINNISSCVFGIYLIHDNPNVRLLLWNNIFNGSKFTNSYFLILYMILSVLIIFMISLLIELTRKYTIEKFNIKYLDIISKQYYKIIKKKNKLI